MDYRGHRTVYVDEGRGEPIVFVHNGGVSHRLWDLQLEHFRRSHRVVAPDLLGHGESDRPQLLYTAEHFVGQLEELVDGLELERFHLVGCCVGGGVGLEYARRHPARVRTLTAITVATPATVRSGLFAPFERVSRPGTRRRDLIARLCETDSGKACLSWVCRRYQCGPEALKDAKFREHIERLHHTDGQWRVFCNTSIASFAHLDEFERPAGFPPTLLMWGGRNPILRDSAGRALAAVLRPERLEFWDDCGYMLMRERPGETNRALGEHFAIDESRAGQTRRAPRPLAAGGRRSE